MQKLKATIMSSVVARKLGKAKRVDSVRTVLLLLKRNLKSSVQAEGRLVAGKSRKKIEGLEKFGLVGYKFAVVLIHVEI